MSQKDEEQIRRNAARWALFAYAMTVIAAIFGLANAINGDANDAIVFALSAVFTLVSAIGFTMRTRGY